MSGHVMRRSATLLDDVVKGPSVAAVQSDSGVSEAGKQCDWCSRCV